MVFYVHIGVNDLENLKPFKSLNQQLKILRDKGLYDVNSKSKRELEKIGYYCLINGYNKLFLEKDPNGNAVKPERYKEGVRFEEIVNLYDFDRELRSILYEGISLYESMLAAKIAYYFSETYPEPNSYLIATNFDNNANNIKYIAQLINKLSSAIQNNANKNTAIKHYLSKYGHIPLWVLVNYLTFGELNNFYKNCTSSVQKNIASAFEKERCVSYYNSEQLRILISDMVSVNHLLNHFRNVVAHNEITFSHHLDKSPKKLSVFTYDSISSQAGVFEVLLSLKLMLRKKDYFKLKKRILKLIEDYNHSFNSIDFKNVLFYMNFPDNYVDIL